MDDETISSIDRYIIKVKQHFNPKYVVLFGSYLRGEQREFSDIDIAVVFEKYEGENILDDNAFFVPFGMGSGLSHRTCNPFTRK